MKQRLTRLATKAQQELAKRKAVVKKLQVLYRNQTSGRGKEWRTKPDWAKIVNKALLKEDKKLGPISATKAMQLIRHLYNTESKRAKIKGKKTTFIKLLDRRKFVELDQLMSNGKTAENCASKRGEGGVND